MLASPFYHHNQTPTPTYSHHRQQREFLPKIPSPLSPRSANIHGSATSSSNSSSSSRPQQPNFNFISENNNNSSNNDASKPSQNTFTFTTPAPAPAAPLPFSKRAIKRAPTVSQDALTERRRGIFLKKVREGREDRRFERHGEDIMRLDFVQRQRKWEAEQARVARFLPCGVAEEEEEDGDNGELPASSGNAMQMSSQWDFTPEEADEVARRESEELEELLSLLPGDAGGLQYYHQQQQQQDSHQAFGSHQPPQRQEEHFGSDDDDDYDALFSDLINEEAHGMPEVDENTHTTSGGDDAMDMS